MAYSSNFQKGLMMGLAMSGLPVSDNQSGSSEPYVLPIASSTVLGGIKIGNDLSIDSEGVVSIPALAGSSDRVTVENAVIIQEKDAAYLVHKYETVEYIAGNKIGYLAQPSLIISNGYTADPRYVDQYRYTDMTFVKGGRGTSTQYDNYRVYLEIVSASYQGYTTVRIRTNDYTGSSYKTYDMTKTNIALNYDTIYSPTSAFPYGYAKFRLVLYCVDSGSTSATWKETVEIYCGFASLAEYNAAIGLTYEPNTLTAVEETVTTE